MPIALAITMAVLFAIQSIPTMQKLFVFTNKIILDLKYQYYVPCIDHLSQGKIEMYNVNSKCFNKYIEISIFPYSWSEIKAK